ncbi:MAG: hypothetical protein Q8Q85_11675, partial [Gemmatimonadales bacterium]|nr:hypothetical protein [Gemmatimonadales bacterium]
MSASTRGFYWRHIVRPYPREISLILGLMLGGAALDMVAVGLTVPLFDALMRPDQPLRGIALAVSARLDAWGWPYDGRAVVFALLGCAAILFIAQSALLFLDQLATNVIAVRLRRELKCRLFERFLRGEYEAVTAYPRGTVVHHVNDPAMDL